MMSSLSWNVLDTWVADDTKTDLYSAREGQCKVGMEC